MNTSGSDDVARLRLFASALAGRLVEVEAAEPGIVTWTDGSTIYVDAEAARDDQFRCVAVQASLLRAGSLDPALLQHAARRPALARRYLHVEGHRALAAQEHLLPQRVRAVVDSRVAARSDSPAASLQVAAGREPIDEPPTCFGVLRPRRLRPELEQASEQRRAEYLPGRHEASDLEELDDSQDVGAVIGFLSSPVGGGGPIGRWLKRLTSSARSPQSGPAGADRPARWGKPPDKAPRYVARASDRAPIPDDDALLGRRRASYPEWDVHRGEYRRNWCTVIESEPDENELVPLRPPNISALQRTLANLGLDLERRRRQLQGDDVDIDAVVERRVDIRAAAAPDEAVYVDSVRQRRDLSVLVLLDVSGSAGERSATGSTVHVQQRSAAAALTLTLHHLGDRVALYAFRSMGRSAVHVMTLKRFDDGVDAHVLGRLGGLHPAAYTRLGAAIRHGASVLEERGGTARRLLVVVSDGFAYDHGYAGDYGEADARRALRETRRRGTACLCLSIGTVTDAEVLRRVFGTAAHARIPRVDQMPSVVGPLFRTALRSADVQRRASQRTVRTRERLKVEGRTL